MQQLATSACSRRLRSALLLLLALASCTCEPAPAVEPARRPPPTRCRPPAQAPALRLTDAFPDQRFDRPTAIARHGESYFVVEQGGVVRRLVRDGEGWRSTPFLDVTGLLGPATGEAGLLGFALSPDFDRTGEVFAAYTGPSALSLYRFVVSRFVSRDGGATADPASEEVVLALERDIQGHNGGRLLFGPDRLLYVAIGDGSWGDPDKRAQNPDELFGKLLRIDPLGARPYRSPDDNPFAAGGGRPEIYALGFRNPWSFSFDDGGRLWLGDVGHDRWEEINLIERGGNYGWPIREGRHCFDTSPCEVDAIDPVHEYPHVDGFSVIGGHVYRGSNLPLRGTYVFGDFMTGRIWGLDAAAPAASRLLADTGLNISGFGEDPRGELLVVAYSGQVFRLDPSTPSDVGPTSLRALGCLDEGSDRMAPGLLPYDVISPLWADGLDKRRWLSIPEDAFIHVTDSGGLELPVGSMLFKELSSHGRRVETRLFVRDADFGWLGYAFEWNADQSDAVLLEDSKTVDVDGLAWTIPSRAQCTACHTAAVGRVLGFELAQLNRPVADAAGWAHAVGTRAVDGAAEEQLDRLARAALFDKELDPRETPSLTDPYDDEAPVEPRARSYLHANCSFCHRPSGPGPARIDLRATVSLEDMHVLCRRPDTSDIDTQDVVVAPGEPARSMLTLRMGGQGVGRMPPLGTARIDARALDVVSAWVGGLEGCR